MHKNYFLMPFLGLYYAILFISNIIYSFFYYTIRGFFVIIKCLLKFALLVISGIKFILNIFYKIWLKFYNIIKYLFNLEKTGIMVVIFFIKKIIHYIYRGFDVYFYFVGRGFMVIGDYFKDKYKKYNYHVQKRKEQNEKRRLENKKKKLEMHNKKIRRELSADILKDDSYVDKSVELNKDATFKEKILFKINQIKKIPSKILLYLNKKKDTLTPIDLDKEVDDFTKDVLNLDEDPKKKTNTKTLYEYVAKDKDGKTVKGYFEAFNKMEVKSFLVNEGLQVYSIRTNKWITMFHKDTSSGKVKFKTKDLVFFLTQLSTYIKAGIPLAESLEILTRQFKNKNYQRIIKSLVYDLNLGVNLSEAMEKQGQAFPKLLMNMVKASEMTGALPEVLDDQAEYFDQMEQTRKQMITAMMYPSVVFIIAMGVLTFVMLFVVPQFVDIFNSMDGAEIPAITVFIMNLSSFLKKYMLFIFIGIIIFIVIFVALYKNVILFRRWIQIIIMHIPVFGNVVIYNEVTTFTKTFSSLMAHNVYITDTMNILKKLTNNEIYKDLINKTIDNLSTGEKISLAFKDHWAFPVPAYEMLVTGERTGELPEMMAKVSVYYQDLHKNSVARIKVFVEPLLIVSLTVLVGLIVLSIVVPMFQMYNSIQQM